MLILQIMVQTVYDIVTKGHGGVPSYRDKSRDEGGRRNNIHYFFTSCLSESRQTGRIRQVAQHFIAFMELNP